MPEANRNIAVRLDHEGNAAVICLDPQPDYSLYPRHGLEVVDAEGEVVAVLRFNSLGALCDVELLNARVQMPPAFREGLSL